MSPAQQSIRAFIAVNLPTEVKAGVGRLQRELAATPGGQAVRWIEPVQVHVTLRFLGDTPAAAVPELEAALRRAAGEVAPFDLSAEGLGCFPSVRQPRIIWVGLSGAVDALRSLHDAVARETAPWGQREVRVFQPHLTIGRVKQAETHAARALAAGLATRTPQPSSVWRVSAVDLMQSQLYPAGAQYLCLVSVPLRDNRETGESGAG